MTDPTGPVRKGGLNVGSGYGIALNGNHAYVETDGGGAGIFANGTVGVINIANPADPVPVMDNTNGYYSGYATYFHKNHIFNVSFEMIGIYDVSNPALLVHKTNVVTSRCKWAAFSGDYMYAVDDDWFKIWNIANPAAPIIVSSNQQTGNLSSGGVAISSNHAYAMGQNGKICIYDISAPAALAAPVTTHQLQQTNSCDLGEAQVLGNFLLVSGQSEFYVLDISVPASPQQMAWYPTSSSGNAWGFANLKNRYAIVADDDRYLVLQLW